jgi:steroid 5-alpha reductase family enzyme
MFGSWSDYATAFAATQAVFLALWLVSLAKRDSSVVDFWWGPGFLAQLGVAAWASGEALAARDVALIALVGAWGLRLGWTLGRRRLAEGHEDPRYAALRAAWNPGFWWKSLFLVFVLQAVVQWLIALGPLSALMAPESAIGALGALGIAVALAGFGLETVADAQLDRFKRQAPRDALCETGLRAYLRHPNYLGEIVFWIGIGLVALEAGAWAGALSPLLIAIFLTSVSGAPVLDEHLSNTRPGYAAYRARVPGFLPALRPLSRDG